ncbi:ras association domain-containing protein 4-like [Mya arenaria]|uniref:ras association domain-containing protein 4-like n=1 Tax=Mya arenaria TaxID=6604 RepID=UPI0022E5A842|nr:ras association domain-containing protein 4-like [Mya arenaria]
MSSKCSSCGKPVYFAERKTSLGRDWHPSCLRCRKCGKVLAPGQHAEHKGTPFCHKPCYSALFGPELFGYGSNVTSPSRKSNETTSDTNNSYLYDDGAESNGKTCVYKTTNTSPGPIKFQRNYSEINASPNVFPKRHSSGNISGKPSDSNGYHNNNGILGKSGLSVVNESSGKDSGLKLVYQSNQNDGKRPTATVTRSHSDVGLSSLANGPAVRPAKVRGAELFKKVQIYNEYHNNKRGQQLEITENEGNVRVQGALRIYWGLKKPIILQQYDKVPTDPILKKRYSIVTDHRDFKPLQEMKHESEPPGSPTLMRKQGSVGYDDSVLHSPSSDVVMRRPVKKSNTVAYRGDRPNRWKRASINGHIYNYDTSVFTPVLGSCTSVTVDNKMTVQQVITTLLDKFKVENKPDEYNLCIITEQEGDRFLKETDIPLLERLILSPTDSVKIFIRDRPETLPAGISPAHIPEDQSPSTESPPEETHLPEELQQLIDIPEPVLRGLLDKFKRDEEIEVKRLKNKYERIRRRVQQIINDKKANLSRC